MAAEYPIADYALIGNCETAALVNSDGGIDWLCLPAFDAPSFFGALLDREKGGEFVVRPAGAYRVQRAYLGDTAILQTRFLTSGGTVLLTDFFVVAREPKARFYDFTSLYPTRKVVRLVELETGNRAEVQVRISARPDYARRDAPDWVRRDGGFACAEAAIFSNQPLGLADGDLGAQFDLRRGERVHIVLDYSDDPVAPEAEQIDRWLAVTQAFWSEWNLFNYYRGRHQDVVRRSAITLKLLTYAPSGAFVAAPTTSLPEKIGGDANWDYRLTWIRDTSLFINALFRIGYSGEAKAYFEYLAQQCGREGGGDLPVFLPIRANTDTTEQHLNHLSGYRNSKPVRKGNRAGDQLQLDNYGHFLQSLFFWKHTGGKLDEPKLRLARNALEQIRRCWHEPDNGIWEALDRRHYTYSKAAAWLAVQRGCELGLMAEEEAKQLSAQILNVTLHRGTRSRETGEFLAADFSSDTVDASALLTHVVGFIPDELARSTRKQVERQLAEEPWLYRSETHREDGEGAFVLCTFWLIDHLLREGEIARAEKLLDGVIARASALGLFSEQIDPASGAFLGNFPQAFSHLGLITATLNIEQSKCDPSFARLPEHEKFQRSVGITIGVRGVIAGFWRVPKTLRLLFSTHSKWKD